MKKTILIIISLFFIISCENENLDDNINSENISNTKSNLDQNRYTEGDPEILAYKLKIVAYITGRVLLNSPRARTVVTNQLQGRNSISFNELFYPNLLDDSGFFNQYFKTAFEIESMYFEGRPTSHRPIPPITRNRNTSINHFTEKTNSLFTTENNKSFIDLSYSFYFSGGVSEFVETNCFELYFAQPLDILENNHIYIVNHPLMENDEVFESDFVGFYLSNNAENQEIGDYVRFDEELLNSINNNILIVRPYRTDDCSFKDIDVEDFTDFYKN